MFRSPSILLMMLVLCGPLTRTIALDSVPRPMARPTTIYDLELQVTTSLPVVPNKRNAKQRNYRPKSGVKSTAKVIKSRKGMYVIELFEDGAKLPGEYLISHKWADRILDIDAVLKVAQMNKVIEEATTPIAGTDCDPQIPIPEPRPESPAELEAKRIERASNPTLNESILSALSTDANKVTCLKNASRDSELAEGLYDSLVSVFAMSDCGQKITSISSKIPSKAAFAPEPVRSCAIELNFLTNDQSEGDLEVALESGEKVMLKWKSPETKPLTASQWLYQQGDSAGFMAQEGFAKICPELALEQDQALKIAAAKTPEDPVTRGAKPVARLEDGPIEPTSNEVQVDQERSEVSLTLEDGGTESVDLPENVPRPRARPANLGRTVLPESVPRPVARPESIEEKSRTTASAASSSKPLCEMSGVSAQWVKNCEALYQAGIPKDALEYALKVMQMNDDSFSSNKCYRTGPSGHYSMRGVSKRDFERKMSGGLPNKCQMVINDTRDKLGTYRGRMYYIDLCSGSAPKIVKSYFNMGTGTFKNNYSDTGGAHTTVKGAFFTNYKTFSFQKNNSAYRAVKSRVQSLSGSYRAPSVQLFGLSNSNNNAGPNLKYMHVSGYKSSWGCPSIAPENYWMIEKLASNGPSLVLNYGTGMEDIRKCSN